MSSFPLSLYNLVIRTVFCPHPPCPLMCACVNMQVSVYICTQLTCLSLLLQALLEHQKGIQLCFETERCHQNTPLHAAASLGKTHVVEVKIHVIMKDFVYSCGGVTKGS